MFKKFFSAAVVSVVAILVICWFLPSFARKLNSVPSKVEREIVASTSDDDLVDWISEDLNKDEADLAISYRKIYKAKDSMDSISARIASATASLAKEKANLAKCVHALEGMKEGATIKICGQDWTQQDIKRDSDFRIAKCESLETQIAEDKKSFSYYEEAYTIGNKAIDTQMENIRQMRIKVDIDKVMLAAKRARRAAKAMRDEVLASISAKSNAYSPYISALRERSLELDADEAFDAKRAQSSGAVIPWEDNSPTNTLEKIKSFLSKDTTPTSKVSQ